MSGAWAVFNSSAEEEPEIKSTTRLRLQEITSDKSKYITHLSAMTVQHGDLSLYSAKKASLGEDPLRSDANPNLLYDKIIKSKKSIGALIMDQSYFSGPGNIYRAEILFLAGVYPTVPGVELNRSSFDRIWDASVKLLRRGYDTGSILTVDPNVDPLVAARGERRYIYNKSTCARCGGRVSSWDMSGRTCYACESGQCQPRMKHIKSKSAASSDEVPKQHVPFISHCAPTTLQQRLEQYGAEKLTIAELRSVIEQMIASGSSSVVLPPKSAKKSIHVELLNSLLSTKPRATVTETAACKPLPPPLISAQDAAREKATSGENRAVEHIAELSREQAIKAISVTPSSSVAGQEKKKRKRAVKKTEGKSDDLTPKSTHVSKRRRSSPRRLTYET